MKIALIVPPASSIRPSKCLLPPLGLAYIAASIQEEGHQVVIIDALIEGMSIHHLLERLAAYRPDCIGVSFMSPQLPDAVRVCDGIRKLFPSVPILVGGAHATCFPRHTLERLPGVDILVKGEGERIIKRILFHLDNKQELGAIEGIAYRGEDGQIVEQKDAEEPVDIEHIPKPARELLDILAYGGEPFESRHDPSTSMIVSRGCPYSRCIFCYRSGPMRRPHRVLSVASVIDEIDHLQSAYGVKEVLFYDDDFFADPAWLMQLGRTLSRRRKKLHWFCRARVGKVDHELLACIRDAGCYGIEIGFESGSQKLLDTLNKGISLKESLRTGQMIRSLGMDLVGTFMLGLPGETPDLGQRTISFAIDLDCTFAAFIPLHPLPGTGLYEICKKQGCICCDDYYAAGGRFAGVRYVPRVAYVPEGYKDAAEVEEMVRHAYRAFYLRWGFMRQHLHPRQWRYIRRYLKGAGMLLRLLR